MDNDNSIILTAAQTVEADSDMARAMADALATALLERCRALDAVAIPGFGTFSAMKTDEYVATHDDGRRTLMPPHISVTFTPGSMLRKHLSANE